MAHGEPFNAVNYIYVEPTYATGVYHHCPTLTFTPLATNKTPHKCPCCDGWGERIVTQPLDTNSGTLQTCRGCGGSGVVWGQ